MQFSFRWFSDTFHLHRDDPGITAVPAEREGEREAVIECVRMWTHIYLDADVHKTEGTME